jgi:hypothetical protein
MVGHVDPEAAAKRPHLKRDRAALPLAVGNGVRDHLGREQLGHIDQVGRCGPPHEHALDVPAGLARRFQSGVELD